MKINITGRHVEITDPIRDYATEKFSHLQHYYDKITNIHLVLGVEKLLQMAEATLHIPHKEPIHAESESHDMYSSIDLVVDKIKKQLLKVKEKEQKH